MALKNKKPGDILKKIIKFFGSIKSELKKVVWPDRKKLVQSTVTVITICVLTAVVVFGIDKILSGILTAVGFYPEIESKTGGDKDLKPTPIISLPAISIPEESSKQDESTSKEESKEESTPETEESETPAESGEEVVSATP